MKTIGQKIKQRRKQLGLTQPQLASKISTTKQRIDELERTSTRPSAEMLFKVAGALEAPMLYFLTDCELNDVDEEILLVKFRSLPDSGKRIALSLIDVLEEFWKK